MTSKETLKEMIANGQGEKMFLPKSSMESIWLEVEVESGKEIHCCSADCKMMAYVTTSVGSTIPQLKERLTQLFDNNFQEQVFMNDLNSRCPYPIPEEYQRLIRLNCTWNKAKIGQITKDTEGAWKDWVISYLTEEGGN